MRDTSHSRILACKEGHMVARKRRRVNIDLGSVRCPHTDIYTVFDSSPLQGHRAVAHKHARHLATIGTNHRISRIDGLVGAIVARGIRNQFASEQQRRNRHAAIHNVLAIIAGIVPAAMGIPSPFTVHARVEPDAIVQVSSRSRPLARKIGSQVYTATLVIKRLDVSEQFLPTTKALSRPPKWSTPSRQIR